MLPPGERIPFAMKKPALPIQPEATPPNSGNFGYTDSFEGNSLALSWMGIRDPQAPFYKVEEGALNLACHGGLGNLDRVPSFVGRRQQHHVATISTTVSFTPAVEGDTAGLAAVQNDQHLIFIGITQHEGKDQVALYRRQGSADDTLIAAAPLASTKDVTLSLAFDGGKMQAYYEVEGQRQLLADGVDATNLSTNVAGGFVGTIIGPYCTSK
jgi:alpha-N-arabinofuranosidase